MRLVEMQAFKVICAPSIVQPCFTHVASFLCLSNMRREPVASHDFSAVADSIYRKKSQMHYLVFYYSLYKEIVIKFSNFTPYVNNWKSYKFHC